MRFIFVLLTLLAGTAVVALSFGSFEPARAVCQANRNGC
jgi:hypothetical protein